MGHARTLLVLALLLAAPAALAVGIAPAGADGRWEGFLLRDGAPRVVHLDLVRTAGGYRATLSLPELARCDIPVPVRGGPPRLTLSLPGGSATVETDAALGTLRGTLTPDDGEEVPAQLVLQRIPAPPPLPVERRRVTFSSHDGVELAGTLVLPPQPGPHPGMVFVQGRSYGPREQFLGYALHLARHGFAGLVFDGRGHGGSGGEAAATTAEDRFADAAAALELLRRRPEVDGDRVGLFGHSAGGWVVPVVADRHGAAFLILHSAPAVPLAEQQGQVVAELARRAGLDGAAQEAAAAYQRWLVDAVAAGTPWEKIAPRVAAARRRPWGDSVDLPAGPDDGEVAFFRRQPYDPVPALRRTRVPVLALYGAEDWIVPPIPNLARLGVHLSAAGNRRGEIVVLPRADHGMVVRPEDGWPRLAPGLLDTMTRWLAGVTGGADSE